MSLYDVPLETLAGEPTTLAQYRDRPVLIVNVASRCGLTPQYEQLEQLHEKYADQGFSVLGFPCNQFAGQEPGSAEEIAEFCSANYGVSFPMFAKADVSGPGKQPLYAALTRARPTKEGPAAEFRERLRGYGMTPNEDPEVLWNFEKFLIDRSGTVIGRFAPGLEPEDRAVVGAIESALAS